MTVNELMNALKASVEHPRTKTCDILLNGDGEKEVKRVAVCFKATAEVITKAFDGGYDLLIPHEPVFYGDEFPADGDSDPIVRAKKKILKDSELPVYRFHDHAHLFDPDFIHSGFINALGLKLTPLAQPDMLGVRRYALEKPMSAVEISLLTAEKLGVPHPRLVGNADTEVRTVYLGLGSVGVSYYKLLLSPGADMFITGESSEVLDCEYIRDAAYFGFNKALLLLGHCGSEYMGMNLLASYITSTFSGIKADYLHCGEVFTSL